MSLPLEKRVNWASLRQRYKRSTKAEKTQLLNELCDLYGMNRKYLTRKLNTPSSRKKRRRGAKPTYPAKDYLPPLKKIWFVSDQLCSKRLKAILPSWLPYYEYHYGKLPPSIYQGLLTMSPSTIDRLLYKVRVSNHQKGLCGTKPGTLIKTQIPIKTNQWNEKQPGYMEADTVAHCGTSLQGDFVWSLTMTDIATGWTENRATWNKGAHGVCEQINDIETHLPFTLKGFDCDNGSEFLNYHIVRYFTERPASNVVHLSRSRPYKKNDNAHVEQKNWTTVRQLFGYDRFDNPRLVALMNDLYKNEWSLWQNYFLPNMKCIEKVKVNSRYKKIFDKPRTPYQRVLASEHIDEKQKDEIKTTKASLDPFLLKKKIEQKLRRIFQFVNITSKVRMRL